MRTYDACFERFLQAWSSNFVYSFEGEEHECSIMPNRRND